MKKEKEPNLKKAFLIIGVMFLIVLFLFGPEAVLEILKKIGARTLGLILVCVIFAVVLFIKMSIISIKDAREEKNRERFYAEERRKQEEEAREVEKKQSLSEKNDDIGDMNLF